ncbi:MAG: hypothetical protein A3H49_08115 [Nitrospirae bacterium RIFCSPLOWO2_02_FULL_62_14]|nr:MAG: hypothetical protein A3H49_08115 [Nitrospirae bacterium RIFCSPLOWO2_02_FULL_62_14]OGW70430.1 MAG: hypothetical protein A3A88_00940 [Nitrospirae bacterium RIFCSPLOWO2_01_FULL_62_17]
MATQTPPDQPGNGQTVSKEVELLRVLIAREGKQVSAQWAVHPQLKQDLQPGELKEVTELMAKVTTIVGSRFTEILSETEPDKPGTA